VTMIPFSPALDDETRGGRIRSLLAEARTLAADQVVELEHALAQVGLLSAQVLEGGDIYPPGLREIARRLAEDAPWATQTLAAIRQRTLDNEGPASWRVVDYASGAGDRSVTSEDRSFAPHSERTGSLGLMRTDRSADDDLTFPEPIEDDDAPKPPAAAVAKLSSRAA